MPDNTLDIKELPDGIAFKVRVQPRSSKNTVAGIMGDYLKINLTAPPVDGAANAACTAFIASFLAVPKSSVVITNGPNSRLKVIKVTGMDKMRFFTMLARAI